EPVKLINGFEAFTPDGEFIMGETPEVRGLWVACGFCAHGIAGGGGVGKVMAEWIVEGQPFVDMAKMAVRRFAPQYRSKPLALAFLQRITCNQIDKPVGSIIYTQMLNSRGGIECDLTVTRLAADRFYIITGTAFGPHDLAHMRRHAPDDGSVYLDDVTSSRAV